jgi:hypothetical protein
MAYTYGPALIPWYEPAPTQNIYITATTGGTFGTGATPTAPIDCTTQSKYDAFLQTLSTKPGAAIYYDVGVYLTFGYNYPGSNNKTAFPHNYHVGAGIDQTIVRLCPEAALET